ncbi:hypothetical protein UCRPC4_g01828 [Phaeomoniella chlamydospora]|uniref:Uncharacterized protein n=1 Tax=Phaeomoniella chlamydospora TaxID=158046 RepID=A0A0G2H9X0_PHACM|nr:hypothetical protein UCRPC4_g01828 [Phaeomoniella chlamydospora]
MLFGISESAFVCGKCAARLTTRLRPSHRAVLKDFAKPRKRYLSTPASSEQPEDQVQIKPFVAGSKNGHRKRNQFKVQKLGVSRLGKPADIIIVDDEPSPRRSHRETPTSAVEQKTASTLDVIHDLMREVDHKLTPAEVNDNIDSLKKAVAGDQTLVPLAQLDELAKVLQQGFSTMQLHFYITHALGISESKHSDNLDKADAFFKDYKHTITSKPANQLAKSGDSTRSRKERNSLLQAIKKSSKLKLASIIVDRIWGLKAIGEPAVHDVALDSKKGRLLRDVRTPEIRELFRSPGRRISVSADGKNAKLTGPNEDIEQIVTRFNEIVSQIVVQTFHVPRLPYGSEADLDANFVRHLSHKYNVVVTREQSNNWTITSYPGSSQTVDAVLRDIYTERGMVSRKEKAIIWAGDGYKNINKVDGVLSEEHGWFHQQVQGWKRLSGNAPPPAALSLEHAVDLAMLSKITSRIDALPSIADGLSCQASATFGQSLFAKTKSKVNGPDRKGNPTASALPSITHDSVAFARNYPRLLQTLAAMEFQSGSKEMELILSPMPSLAKVVNPHPPIRVTLSTSDRGSNGKPVIEKISAVLDHNHSDLLLPHAPVDIRFEVQLRYDIPRDSELFIHISALLSAADIRSSSSPRKPLLLPPIFDLPVYSSHLSSLLATETTMVPRTATEKEARSNAADSPGSDASAAVTPGSSAITLPTIPYMLSSSTLIDTNRFHYNSQTSPFSPSSSETTQQEVPLRLLYLSYSHHTFLPELGKSDDRQWRVLQLLTKSLTTREQSKATRSRKFGAFVSAAKDFAERMGQT